MFGLLLSSRPRDLICSFSIVLSTLPFRLLLPGTLPRWVSLGFPLAVHAVARLKAIPPIGNLCSEISPPANLPAVLLWPPSPALLGLVIVPLLRSVYNRLFDRFKLWVLESPLPPRKKRYLSSRIQDVMTLGSLGGRRVPAPADVPIDVDADRPEAAPLHIAVQIVQKDQTSLTHDVLHAVSSIVLPRLVGNLLLAASRRSFYLRGFLGLRSPGQMPVYPDWAAMTLQRRVLAASKAVAGILLGSSGVWAESDPIWWRTSLGYGMFVLVCIRIVYCLELYRLWLQKREVQSRKIKNRDFSGVDVTALDLIEPERFP
ncbi:hypothetical protein B0H16DRAFT_1316208 [Mycena metata]|uniref:Uncharacterized protein n=1 Tax=Mycena metata TaxID=1033252 RepID=A0AAD7J2Q0_9AGAR|nr:hypothetical protein B0H16DRAFT_1316208 [Mycena metata]